MEWLLLLGVELWIIFHVIKKSYIYCKYRPRGIPFPLFEIATFPEIHLSEIKARRFNIIDRAQIKAKEEIQRQEDINIFEAIHHAVNNSKTIEAEKQFFKKHMS